MITPAKIVSHLSDRAIFRVTGNDAETYLNGQVSQDLRLATESTAVYSIVANFKGKLEGDFFIRRYKGDLLIDTCGSQRKSLLARLDKYLIADDAEITDISEEYHFYHSIGNFDSPISHTACEQEWECNRYGQTGTDYLFLKSESIPPEEFDSKADIKCEQLRISCKIPLWGKELDESTLPPEASLESRAISYTKGCYTGQEVISRMKSAGKTNRHLVGFRSGIKISTPLNLSVTLEAEDKPTAVITSACEAIDSGGGWIGLGYRTRKAEVVNEFFDAEGNSYTII